MHFTNHVSSSWEQNCRDLGLKFHYGSDCKSENRSAPLIPQISLYQNLQCLLQLYLYTFSAAMPLLDNFDLHYFTQWGKGTFLFLQVADLKNNIDVKKENQLNKICSTIVLFAILRG